MPGLLYAQDRSTVYPKYSSAAEEVFSQGLEFFKVKDYSSAKTAFEKARDMGLNNSRLFYNLGVTHYKLENYQQAYDAFQLALNLEEMRFLAHYNSALSAEKLQQTKSALDQLVLAKNYAHSVSQKELLRRLQNRLGISETFSLSHMSIFSYGYSDNVAFANEDVVASSESKDHYFSLSGSVGLQSRWGLGANFRYLLHRYRDMEAYDYDDGSAELAYSGQTKSFQYHSSLDLKRDYLGGDTFTDRYSVRAGATTIVSSTSAGLSMSYVKVKPLQTNYSYLKGNSQKLNLFMHYNQNWRAAYEVEENERLNSTTVNASPTRNKLLLSFHPTIGKKSRLKLEFSARESEFSSIDSLSARSDRQRKASAEFVYAVSPRSSLIVVCARLVNESTDPFFNFDTTHISLGLVVR
ncbi:MAG: tetratricopeptide repeat protein [Gammaproteobacteria bacterium]|nr:tetratricopeptide repeat protein [Gammaproteobacteria bacterium]MDH5802199.1 tetratricopeptide repeat protein [Gammaproteobacteria bacterium]